MPIQKNIVLLKSGYNNKFFKFGLVYTCMDDFKFTKSNEFRLGRLVQNTKRLSVDDTVQEFRGLVDHPLFERLLSEHYSAAFRFECQDDVLYTFRNKTEIAFGGVLGNAVLGISTPGMAADNDSKYVAASHQSPPRLLHYLNRGLIVTGNSQFPKIELYSPRDDSVEELKREYDFLLARFDLINLEGLKYTLEKGSRRNLYY